MHFSACAASIFLNTPLHESIDMVAECGLKAYEFWSWWDQDIEKILAVQQEKKLAPVGLCTKFIPLTDPLFRQEYLAGLQETIEVCKKLGCKKIISQVGQELPEVSREQQHMSIVDGLKAAAPYLRAADILLLVEPLNTKIDHKGYYLNQSEEAFQIIDEVGSKNIKVLFDLYHQYISNDLCIEKIVANLPQIGHFHMAGYPGRNEPMTTNEIGYHAILSALKNAGYEGYIGLEYFTGQDPKDSLKLQYEQLKHFED